MVKPVALMTSAAAAVVVFWQIKVESPAQVPENNSTTASVIAVAVGVTVMVWEVETAIKEYHTSSSAVPVQPGWLCVAAVDVPVVFMQVVAEVKLIAFVQASLAGGCMYAQIVPVAFAPPLLFIILTKYVVPDVTDTTRDKGLLLVPVKVQATSVRAVQFPVYTARMPRLLPVKSKFTFPVEVAVKLYQPLWVGVAQEGAAMASSPVKV
jgi:hypothetical protein